MDVGPLLYTGAGLATLAAALLPRLLNKAPISMPMLFLGAGALTFSVVEPLPDPDPVRYSSIVVHLAELCVIVSLMGAGLALNRAVSLRGWSTTWRLLGITMPLSILAVCLLGWGLLGFGIATSILLAGALAPTDPVLASEVQVGEPADDPQSESEEDEARFALTSEAGLNDGLAFPFVYAAIAISVAGAAPAGWLTEWLAVDVGWRLAAGVAVGLLTGWLLGKLFFSAPSDKFRLAEHAEGFVALAATFLAYGFTELVNGYGFVAVFVCACAIRASERHHGYHQVLHSYVEQAERMLTVVIIFLLGGAAATGLFAAVGWREILAAAVILLVIRPLTGWLGLLRSRAGSRERFVIAFFGVRGVGSLFYVAYALQAGHFAQPDSIWRIAGLVVVGSIIVHGVSASPVMYLLDRKRTQLTQQDSESSGLTPR